MPLREQFREQATEPRLPGPPLCLGREAEVRRLVESLLHASSPIPPIAVLGPAGAGKATLLLTALHHPQVEARYGSRRTFVRCDGARSQGALFLNIGRALGLEPWHDLEERLVQELERAPAVLVLAGLDVPWKADPEGVGDLLSRLGSIRSLTLGASVAGMPAGLPGLGEWQPLRLGTLDRKAARDLFLTLAGPRFRADPGLDSLLDAVDRAPLAVSLLANAARVEPDLAAIWKRWQSCLERRSTRLRWQGVHDWLLHVEVPLEVVLTGPGITPDALRLLSLLADLPDGVRLEDLPLLLAAGGDAAPVLPALITAGLAFEEQGRLRVLAPVREEVKREHPPRAEDLDRVVALYLERGVAAEWIEEPGNIHSMLLQGLDGPNPEPAIRAALGLGDLVRSLGWGSGGLSELERAGDVARETGRDELAALCAALLADLARSRSDFDSARERYEEALRRYRHAGEVRGEALCLRNLGDLALDSSDLETARIRLEDALPLFRMLHDARGEAHCLRRTGDAALERDDLGTARLRYEEALPVYRRLRDRLGEASCLRGLGDIAASQSDPKAARGQYGEAMILYRRAGHLQGEAHCLRAQGDLDLLSNGFNAARDRYREALSLYRRVGDLLGQANCLQRDGDLAMALSDPGAARFRYEEALSLYEKVGEPYSLGLIHVRLALLLEEGSPERRRHAEAARDSWSRILRPDLMAMLDEVF
jgi:tetratricopeptide (TPR) repeat protein